MELTEVTKFRRAVLTGLAKFTWQGTLPEHVYDILYSVVTEDGPRVRCCVHKERAVLKNRINMALGLTVDLNIVEASTRALAEPVNKELPIIDVLPEACDQCPIDKFLITDACRHCVAHKCMNKCPKQAISIHQNRAYIDKSKCIECGMCKKVCPYGAIIEVSRPCERACPLDAITAGADRKAKIDTQKCVQCGACRSACPFGAIDERSSIVQLIQTIKSGQQVYALLAPSFIGQLGFKVTPEQIVAAIKKWVLPVSKKLLSEPIWRHYMKRKNLWKKCRRSKALLPAPAVPRLFPLLNSICPSTSIKFLLQFRRWLLADAM